MAMDFSELLPADEIKPDDKDMLEDLVAAAVTEGLNRSKELANSRMGSIAGALGAMGLGF